MNFRGLQIDKIRSKYNRDLDGFLSSARARIRRISWRGATVTRYPTGKQRFFNLLSGKAGVMSTGDIN